ncbi:phytanoyl-CoA dioxygenase family protein [Tengunoibacter tsumagoiensis]|uniref:Phytanoyl-CoA dioxygenase n=1 Tax=Tengunoibacter tsumagoiensis TaxID=2014871 RepID=A0A402A9Q5_9CHLR|nr:phytanoyl-CoA dioxygenase family protein [Tengunoibacter tsumagoiensis]GCE15892.1 hypothetical protein KTT_57510 [Tengunoibacter tsumagoiensis]
MTTYNTAVMPEAHEYAGRSPFHLTEEQIQFFDDNGYLILRNWIPQDLLQRLQNAGEAWIQQGYASQEGQPLHKDYAFTQRPHGRVMFRVEYLHNKGQEASLELLGSPYVQAVAESLTGANFVPTYESMVFKEKQDGAAIRWHQDAVHPRSYRIFNYDLYLDRSTADGGALRVIPGSQKRRQDICDLTDRFGWEPENVITVEMEPGDVLLHDVMVVHGSPQVEGKNLRRTIYYEFRAAEEIIKEGPWDRTWIDRRLRLLPEAQRHFRQRYPQVEPFTWNVTPDFRPENLTSDKVELKVEHGTHTGGTFCSAGDAGKKEA